MRNCVTSAVEVAISVVIVPKIRVSLAIMGPSVLYVAKWATFHMNVLKQAMRVLKRSATLVAKWDTFLKTVPEGVETPATNAKDPVTSLEIAPNVSLVDRLDTLLASARLPHKNVKILCEQRL